MNRGILGVAAVLAMGVLLAVSSGAVAQTPPAAGTAPQPAHKFTISKGTTYVMGPFRADGTIDYVAAYNEIMGKNLKPEDNAALLILRALPADSPRKDLLVRMGVKTSGPGLPSISRYFSDKGKGRLDANEAETQYDAAGEAPWKPGQFPMIEEYLKAMEQTLADVLAASKRPRLFIPVESQDPSGAGMNAVYEPVLGGLYRHSAGLLKIRAMQAAGAGDMNTALDYCLAARRLGRLVARQGMLLDWLVGNAVDGRGEARGLAKGAALTPGQVRRHLAELDKLGPFPAVDKVVDVGERLAALDLAMFYSREGVPVHGRDGMRFVQLEWDAVLRTTNDFADRLTWAFAKETHSARKAAVSELLARIRKTVEDEKLVTDEQEEQALAGFAAKPVAQRERLSRLMTYREAASWLAPYECLPDAVARQEAYDGMDRVCLALAAHKAEKGEYPPSLDALVPGILKKLPTDPFWDKPFLYKPAGKGFVIYSVGPNGKDDEPKEPDPDRIPSYPPEGNQPANEEPDDIVVKVE